MRSLFMLKPVCLSKGSDVFRRMFNFVACFWEFLISADYKEKLLIHEYETKG